MPRSGWEPWSVFRKPLLPGERVSTSLRVRGTGALRRPAADASFGDVIPSIRTPKRERDLAPHPSLKPQQFMRHIVRAVLPLGAGMVYDPFAGGGSTLAAAEALGYYAAGTEVNAKYAALASSAIPHLAALEVPPIFQSPAVASRSGLRGKEARPRATPKPTRRTAQVLTLISSDSLWEEEAALRVGR